MRARACVHVTASTETLGGRKTFDYAFDICKQSDDTGEFIAHIVEVVVFRRLGFERPLRGILSAEHRVTDITTPLATMPIAANLIKRSNRHH